MIDPRDRITCTMVDECERIDYALYLACHELTDVLGTCPFDQHNWDGCDCECVMQSMTVDRVVNGIPVLGIDETMFGDWIAENEDELRELLGGDA